MTPVVKAELQRDLTAAIRARDEARKRALRVVMALIHSAEARDATPEHPVARDLPDDEIIEILAAEAARRREAIDGYQRIGAEHRADAERAELVVLDGYLDGHPR